MTRRVKNIRSIRFLGDTILTVSTLMDGVRIYAHENTTIENISEKNFILQPVMKPSRANNAVIRIKVTALINVLFLIFITCNLFPIGV
jgi:hypothetical protein